MSIIYNKLSQFAYDVAYKSVPNDSMDGVARLGSNVLLNPIRNLFDYNGSFTAEEVTVCNLGPQSYLMLPFKIVLKRENTLTIFAGLLGLFIILISGPLLPYINSINGFYSLGLSIFWSLIIFFAILIICINYSYNATECAKGSSVALNLMPMFFSLKAFFVIAMASYLFTRTGKN